MSELKRYNVIVSVTEAHGSQTFCVEARDEEHAIQVFDESGGEFVSEEVEVMGLADSYYIIEENIDDAIDNNVDAELTRLQAKVARLESDLEQMRQMGIADLKAECERLRVNARRWDYAFMNCADLDVMTVKELDEAIDAQINQSNKG